MQACGMGRDDVGIAFTVDSRVQLALCKVKHNLRESRFPSVIFHFGLDKSLQSAPRYWYPAVSSCKTVRFALQYGLFRAVKQAVWECETITVATR